MDRAKKDPFHPILPPIKTKLEPKINTKKCIVPGLHLGKPFVAHQVLEPDLTRVLDFIQKRLASDDHPRRRYPGPNPVSIEKKDLPLLGGNRYVACEKTDGSRFAMACFSHQCVNGVSVNVVVLVDRTMSAWLFPIRRVPKAMYQGTLLDGELCLDKTSGNFVYRIFDAVMVSGIPVGHASLDERIHAIRTALRAGYERDASDPASLEIKAFATGSKETKTLLESLKNRFDIDGLVLTPRVDPVVFGRATRLFKLKPRHHITVDFISNGDGRLFAYDPRTKTHVHVGDALAIPDVRGCVVECRHLGNGDPSVKQWTVVKVREDKTTANDLLTFEKTLLNMREKITESEIFSALDLD
jgi:hypothetical protein